MKKFDIKKYNQDKKYSLIKKGLALISSATILFSFPGCTSEKRHNDELNDKSESISHDVYTRKMVNENYEKDKLEKKSKNFLYDDNKVKCIIVLKIDDSFREYNSNCMYRSLSQQINEDLTQISNYNIILKNELGEEMGNFSYKIGLDYKYIFVNEGNYSIEIDNLPKYMDASISYIHVDSINYLSNCNVELKLRDYKYDDFSYIKK